MTIFIAILAGIAGLVVGWGITGFGMAALMQVMGVSQIEGAAAMAALFFYGPIGGLIGLVVGVWLTLRLRRGSAGAGRTIGYSALAFVAIAVLVPVSIWFYIEATNDLVTSGNARPAELEFEIRLPAHKTLPQTPGAVKIELHTPKNTMPAEMKADSPALPGDRMVLRGTVTLYFRVPYRFLVLRVDGEPDRLFTLKLRANPPATSTPGGWERVSHIAEKDAQPRPAGPDDDYDIRYRVRRWD
jgi:hypothetical protein